MLTESLSLVRPQTDEIQVADEIAWTTMTCVKAGLDLFGTTSIGTVSSGNRGLPALWNWRRIF